MTHEMPVLCTVQKNASTTHLHHFYIPLLHHPTTDQTQCWFSTYLNTMTRMSKYETLMWQKEMRKQIISKCSSSLRYLTVNVN